MENSVPTTSVTPSAHSPNVPTSSVAEIFSHLMFPTDQIRKVPPHIRAKQAHSNVYDPVIVSMGPYHHGAPHLVRAEVFKQKCLDWVISHNNDIDRNTSFYHEKILDRIGDIRCGYEEVNFTDTYLAWMMLHDACFFIYVSYLRSKTNMMDTLHCYLGYGTINFVVDDLIMLENQIPFWIIRLVLNLQSENGEATFFNLLELPDQNSRYVPLHKLDSKYREILSRYGFPTVEKCKEEDVIGRPYDTNLIPKHQFRSITNLKAKGIRIKKGPSGREGAISFTSNLLHGHLWLPELTITRRFSVLYSNLIAFERTSTSRTTSAVSEYVYLMKSLIQGPNDVKLLREEGVLVNHIGNDDEVVKMFYDLNTFCWEDAKFLHELKDNLEKYCSNKYNTWKAQLIHTYFGDPWKVIALVTAVLLLGLTCAQTYYTIYPPK